MSDATITFFVAGTPQPGGSKKGFPVKRAGGRMGVAIVDANPKAKAWKTAVRQAAKDPCRGKMKVDGPVVLNLTFYLARPKTVKREHHAVRPDVTKLTRLVEDALTGFAYTDDAQIVSASQTKHYATPPQPTGVLIEIRRL